MPKRSWKEAGFSTRAVHAGAAPEPVTGAVIPPIFATSTFAQAAPGKHSGFEYSRSQNPTRFAYEECVASLEGGAHGFAFASGLAGMATILDTLPSGSTIVASDDLYGGSVRLFNRVRAKSSNLKVVYAPLNSKENIAEAIAPGIQMVWVETPSNPLLKILDLATIQRRAKEVGAITVADNTFASPYLQRPFELGFDIVLHSATKYLNGHSDVIGGVVIVRESGVLADQIAFTQNAVGSVPSPFDCFLAHRGAKTLALRMERHCDNAEEVAGFLSAHPRVERVIYPGLQCHPQHEIARAQMRRFGGMVSFRLKGNLADAERFLSKLTVFTLAESLGGVESLVEIPSIMTHASVPPEVRASLGIDDTLIRLSCGIEDGHDLVADLEQAFL